jgi:hypothetical protein
VRIETTEDFEHARARLQRRDSDTLVAFLMSLAMDSGLIGQQVRTFIVGDDVTETVDSLKKRIKGLSIPSEFEHRHSLETPHHRNHTVKPSKKRKSAKIAPVTEPDRPSDRRLRERALGFDRARLSRPVQPLLQ